MPMDKVDELEQLFSALQRAIACHLFAGFSDLSVCSVKQGIQQHQNHTCADSTCSRMMPEHQLKEYMHKQSRQLLSFSSPSASHSSLFTRVA